MQHAFILAEDKSLYLSSLGHLIGEKGLGKGLGLLTSSHCSPTSLSSSYTCAQAAMCLTLVMIGVGWARGTLAELAVSAALKPQPVPDSPVVLNHAVLKATCSAPGRV